MEESRPNALEMGQKAKEAHEAQAEAQSRRVIKITLLIET